MTFYKETARHQHTLHGLSTLVSLMLISAISLKPSLAAIDSPRSNLPNVAYQKTTYQGPRTYIAWGSPLSSDMAVDGDHAIGSHDVSHTLSDPINFWVVDLGRFYKIQSVAILNRETDPARLQNFTIDIFREDPQECLVDFPQGYGQVCTHQESYVLGGTWGVFDCAASIVGRFLRVVKYGFNELVMSEVEVFGSESMAVLSSVYIKRATNITTTTGGEVIGKFGDKLKCALYLSLNTCYKAFYFDIDTGTCSGIDSDISVW